MGLFGTDEPETVTVIGKPLNCLACGNSTFYQRRAQLHTALKSFFDLEWASPTCICVVCSQCGHVHWFLPHD